MAFRKISEVSRKASAESMKKSRVYNLNTINVMEKRASPEKEELREKLFGIRRNSEFLQEKSRKLTRKAYIANYLNS